MAVPVTTSSDIRALLDDVNAAGSALLSEHVADASPVPEGPVRGRLIAAAEKLIAELKNPAEQMMEATWQVF
jgi:hypothetical protein